MTSAENVWHPTVSTSPSSLIRLPQRIPTMSPWWLSSPWIGWFGSIDMHFEGKTASHCAFVTVQLTRGVHAD